MDFKFGKGEGRSFLLCLPQPPPAAELGRLEAGLRSVIPSPYCKASSAGLVLAAVLVILRAKEIEPRNCVSGFPRPAKETDLLLRRILSNLGPGHPGMKSR